MQFLSLGGKNHVFSEILYISAQPAPPPPAPECFTNGGANPNKPCIFPFTWNGAIYRGCPIDPDDENQRWCSTKVDANGLHIQGQDQWGHCSPSCPISAPPPKRPAPPQRPAAPQGQVIFSKYHLKVNPHKRRTSCSWISFLVHIFFNHFLLAKTSIRIISSKFTRISSPRVSSRI